jgi:outer membrane translocation and assembly module TamA
MIPVTTKNEVLYFAEKLDELEQDIDVKISKITFEISAQSGHYVKKFVYDYSDKSVALENCQNMLKVLSGLNYYPYLCKTIIDRKRYSCGGSGDGWSLLKCILKKPRKDKSEEKDSVSKYF